MVIGPTFMGAEPDRIDEGPHKGLRLFQTEELESLKLMQGLPKELQEKATLSKGMDGKSLPADRWNPFDERHLGGARQDNRVVPYGKSLPRPFVMLANIEKRAARSLNSQQTSSSQSLTYFWLSTNITRNLFYNTD